MLNEWSSSQQSVIRGGPKEALLDLCYQWGLGGFNSSVTSTVLNNGVGYWSVEKAWTRDVVWPGAEVGRSKVGFRAWWSREFGEARAEMLRQGLDHRAAECHPKRFGCHLSALITCSMSLNLCLLIKHFVCLCMQVLTSVSVMHFIGMCVVSCLSPTPISSYLQQTHELCLKVISSWSRERIFSSLRPQRPSHRGLFYVFDRVEKANTSSGRPAVAVGDAGERGSEDRIEQKGEGR